jgi:hypothetical protein
MVEVKDKIKVKPGTVVKIELDDKGDIRVSKGSTPWIDIDEEDDEDASASSATQVTQATPVYHPTEIRYDGKRYVLREPLQCECEFTPNSGGETYIIDYDPFFIWGAGRTMEEAVDFFNFQFATTYDLLNQEGEEKSTPHFRKILKAMNGQVIKVESDGSR